MTRDIGPRWPLPVFHKWAGAGSSRPAIAGWSLAIGWLFAVALELDEQLPPTQTGEMVCRVCSGRGEVIVDLDQGRFIDPAFMSRARLRVGQTFMETPPPPIAQYRELHGRAVERARLIVEVCRCCRPAREILGVRGGTFEDPADVLPGLRPHTVQLHRIVETLAAMRSPRVDDWPEQWLVDIDRREAAGDRSPKAAWWAQFYAWTRGGVVDEHALADALEQLVKARRSSVRVAGGDALAELGLAIAVDGAVPVEVSFGVDYASGPDSTVVAEVERGPDGSLRTLSISTPWSNDDLGARLLAPDRDQLRREMTGTFPPSTGTAADVLAAVRRRLSAERISVSGLRLDETGVGRAHISYDLDRIGRGPEALRAVLAAAREAAPASVHVTAGARRGQARDLGFAVGERGPTDTPAEIFRDDWPFLDP